MTTGSTGSLLPKWQLAVLIGAPIALGLGYLYYRQTSLSTCSGDDGDETDGGKRKKPILKGQTISLDGDDKLLGTDKNSNCSNKKDDEKQKLQQKQPKKALSELEIAIQMKNDGNASFKNGKYDEAIGFYDKAIETCPRINLNDLATFYQNRAAAHEQHKNWLSVINDCTEALKLNPKYTKAMHRRARAFENSNKLNDCLEDITAACILESFQNQNTLMFADRILKSIGRLEAKEAMESGKSVFPSNNFIKTYFESFSRDPIKKIVIASSEPKGFIRAKMAFDAGNYEEIIPACTEELDESNSNTIGDGNTTEYKYEALLLRGTFYLISCKFNEARKDFTPIIDNEKLPKEYRVNALIKRAAGYIQNEQIELGMEDFEMAEKIDKTNPDIYHHRGQVYILMEKLDLAVSEFTKATRLSPNLSVTHVQKCYAEYRLAYLTKDQFALISVMEDFKKAIELFPNCIECYSVMAQVLTDQEQFEQADIFFEKAIKLQPTHASLYVHRGIMQLQWNGDIKKAIEYMEQGLAMDDKCELVYETLGTIEVQRGNLEKAIELFEKALKYAKSETEMVHLYSLKHAAIAQLNVAKKLGIDLSTIALLAQP